MFVQNVFSSVAYVFILQAYLFDYLSEIVYDIYRNLVSIEKKLDCYGREKPHKTWTDGQTIPGQ